MYYHVGRASATKKKMYIYIYTYIHTYIYIYNIFKVIKKEMSKTKM